MRYVFWMLMLAFTEQALATQYSFGWAIDSAKQQQNTTLFSIHGVNSDGANLTTFIGYSYLRTDVASSTDRNASTHAIHAGFTLHPDWTIWQPYVGFGALIGQSRWCPNSEFSDCITQAELALVPETGIRIRVDNSIRLDVKARRYVFIGQDRGDEPYLFSDTLAEIALIFRF